VPDGIRALAAAMEQYTSARDELLPLAERALQARKGLLVK